ncbi:sce7726 family protein [Peribacillus frigoritolerans]|uniref:sce7726 family protein n=1 Tax=Peribacillus castrilensis TaxID=2897690 RepID=UPI00297006E9|nr:sce7726 family protein [Peribacillus castrilensis]
MNKLKDNDIRQVLLKYLSAHYFDDKDTKIINEMGVLHGQSRVDVAVINGILHGYEIKSESDTLLRLPRQIEDYSQVFDRMTIVVQRNYLEAVRGIIPIWWGIMLVTRSRNGEVLNIKEIRKGKLNKSVNAYSLSHLLWRNEALNILKENGLQKGYLSKPRHDLYRKICGSFDLSDIKLMVNQQLKMRENWRAP